jgi:DNA polymerase I-like protein with 3'-5' exonuclease and polymerase domains
MPALKRLRTQVTEAATQGAIKGLDGRWLQIRSEHAALNTLLQGAGAIICKEWLVQMTKQINEMKLNAKLVGSIHDEYQFEVSIEDTPQFCKITKQAILDTEKSLGVLCPLDSEYKIGKTWAETH